MLSLRRSGGVEDLVEYYGVTAEQAQVLGTRAPGRRPDLPGSPTTAPISGRTWEELWSASPRRTPEEIASFYREIGAWAAFRQIVRHHRTRFGRIFRHLHWPGARFLEYGCGVAPVTCWLADRWRQECAARFVLADVRSEHFVFGWWRVAKRLKRLPLVETAARLVEPPDAGLEPSDQFDGIAVLEVLEHLTNPAEIMDHLLDHLVPGGRLWEDFHVHAEGHGAGPDLPQARAERSEVYRILRRQVVLAHGRDPEAPEGGGTREWVRP